MDGMLKYDDAKGRMSLSNCSSGVLSILFIGYIIISYKSINVCC